MDQLSVCNRDVIDYIKRNNIDAASKYVTDKFKEKNSYKTLQKDLTRLHQTYQQLNKSKSRATGKANYDTFMNSLYEFPLFSPDDSEKSRGEDSLVIRADHIFTPSDGPRQANLVLIAYASSEGSGEPAHPRSLSRIFTARSYKQ